LDAGLEALGLRLSEIARSAIDGHVRLLLAWNEAINLSGIRDPSDVAVRHVLDSLVAERVLRRRGIDRYVDLGSGGGFPGLTVAAALPADGTILVESIAKKARFLDTAIAAVGLSASVRVRAARAETIARDAGHRGRWPAVTARAVASLADLVELALPLLRPGGVLVAWKRGALGEVTGLAAELAAAEHALSAIGDGTITVEPSVGSLVTDRTARAAVEQIADHRLVVVERGRRPIAASWPRDPAARKRTPWSATPESR
jgi:16S rRNA (guanine527-N7)-methyltransferase